MLFSDVARYRLARALGVLPDVEHAINPERYAVSLRLPNACLIVRPGLMQLESYTPDRWPPRDWLQLAPHFRARDLFDASAALDPCAVVSTVVLKARKHILHIESDVHERIPPRIDRSGKWKAHPPSKRRRMRSWRYASDAEKLRYAPLAGLECVPWWARHPEAHRTRRIGAVEVAQELFVYAQDSAPIDDLLQRYADEWCGRITEGLRC